MRLPSATEVDAEVSKVTPTLTRPTIEEGDWPLSCGCKEVIWMAVSANQSVGTCRHGLVYSMQGLAQC